MPNFDVIIAVFLFFISVKVFAFYNKLRLRTQRVLFVQISFKPFKRLMLGVSEGLQSLREAMIWTLPCVLIGAIFIATAYLVEVLGLNADLALTLKGLSGSLSRLTPVIVASFLAYILSVKKGKKGSFVSNEFSFNKVVR